jgi:hypothetical protein
LDDVALGVNLLAPTLLRQLRIDGARKRRLALFRSNPCADTRPDGESRRCRTSGALYRGCLRRNLRRAHPVDALNERRQGRTAHNCDQTGRDHALDIDLRCPSRRNTAAARARPARRSRPENDGMFLRGPVLNESFGGFEVTDEFGIRRAEAD